MFPSFLHYIACLHELPLPCLPPPSTWFLFYFIFWFMDVLQDTAILWLNITSVFKLTIFSPKNISLSDHIQFRSCGIQLWKNFAFLYICRTFSKNQRDFFSLLCRLQSIQIFLTNSISNYFISEYPTEGNPRHLILLLFMPLNRIAFLKLQLTL